MDFDEKKLFSFLNSNKQAHILSEEHTLKLIPLIEKGRFDEVKILLTESACANEEDYFKGSALYVAVSLQEYKIAKLLCVHGANPFHMCANHSTPFYEALIQDNHELAMYFIENSFEHHFEAINEFEFFEIMQCQMNPDLMFSLLDNGYNFDAVELYRKFPEYKWIPKTLKKLGDERKSELMHLLHHSLEEMKLYGDDGLFNEIVESFQTDENADSDELVG